VWLSKTGTATGMRPQEKEDGSCTEYANERSSSLDTGLDHDSTVMLTCKLLFAAAKAIVDVGPLPLYIPREIRRHSNVPDWSTA